MEIQFNLILDTDYVPKLKDEEFEEERRWSYLFIHDLMGLFKASIPKETSKLVTECCRRIVPNASCIMGTPWPTGFRFQGTIPLYSIIQVLAHVE